MNKGIIAKTVVYILFMSSYLMTFAQQEIPDNIKDKIVKGINYLENSKEPKDMDSAVVEFSEAAAIAPDFPDIHYYLGKTLSMMQGCAGKAAKELKKYLELYPDAPDKEKVSAEIAQLEEVLKSQNNSYLMGISLIKLSDGIYISRISPNYPLDRFTGRGGVPIKSGDKIIKINDVDITDLSIQSIMKLIEKDTTSGIYRTITIIRGGNTTEIPMLKTENNLDPLIKDIGEEDLTAIIAESKIPVVVFFVSDFCELCEKCISGSKILAYNYKDSVNFIYVNIDENIYIAKEFNISKVPVFKMYKDGKLFDSMEEYDYKPLQKKIEALSK